MTFQCWIQKWTRFGLWRGNPSYFREQPDIVVNSGNPGTDAIICLIQHEEKYKFIQKGLFKAYVLNILFFFATVSG